MTTDDISIRLIELAPQLDGRDRMKLGIQANRSYSTVIRYLNGEVKDLLAGEKILEVARKIIATKTTVHP